MSKIESPWVPAVFDLFPERMYKPYFTMEIVDGFNLCRVLSGLRSRVAAMEERFDLMTLLRLIVRSAEGLAAAHEAGCIHRDVKPENLIIDDEGNLKIVDWGISLDESEGAARDSETQVVSKKQGSGCVERRAAPNSKSDTTIGTPLYMSPEQIRDPTRVDARTDVFSLGAVLYDCLALTTLIHGTTREHVFRYTLGGDYVKPSDVTLRSEVPAAVEEVCMRATRPRAEERFASMDEFRAALVAAAGL